MKLPPNAHVAIVDGEKFLLMQNRGSALGPKLQSEGTPDVELDNKSAGIRHQDSRGKAVGKEPFEKFAHAAGVAEWLNKAVLDRRIEKLLVIADPDTLGEMRPHYHKTLQAALIGELDRQLTGMPGPDIAKAIAAA
jgi:protein required for attachment to host cells